MDPKIQQLIQGAIQSGAITPQEAQTFLAIFAKIAGAAQGQMAQGAQGGMMAQRPMPNGLLGG